MQRSRKSESNKTISETTWKAKKGVHIREGSGNMKSAYVSEPTEGMVKKNVEKGKSKMDDSSRKHDETAKPKGIVDKGKGKMDESSKGHEERAKSTAIGGFMSDARRSYSTRSQEPTQTIDKGSAKKRQKLLPIRRQAAHKIASINLKRKIPGPGSSAKEPMDLNYAR